MTTVSTPRQIATTATTSATLAKGKHTPVDAASGALTMTLPTTAAAGVEVSVEKIDASSNVVTVTGTLRGAASSTIAMTSRYEARTFLSEGGGSWRPISDHRTATSLSSTYSRVSPAAIVANLGTPLWTGHRCGGSQGVADSAGAITTEGPMPENTLEGARAIVAAAQSRGIPNFVLNIQVRELADGTLAAVHDTTVDRTTNGTGRVSGLVGPAWAAMKNDTATWYGASGFGDVRTVTLDDVLREFGGKVAINIGAYNSTEFPSTVGQRVVDSVVSRGLQDTVIIGAFQTANLLPAKAAGIATYYYPPDDPAAGSDAASILAADVWATGKPKRVGINYLSSDAYVSSLVSAGFAVGVYNTSRRYERDRFLGLGVVDLVSNDVIYQQSTTALAAKDVDPTGFKVWPHGSLAGTYGRGKIVDTGGVQLSDVAASTSFCYVQGARGPVAGTTWTLDIDFVVDQLDADTTRYFGIQIGLADDRTPSIISGQYVNCYHIFWKMTGDINIQKVTAPATVGGLGGTLTTRALVAGDVCHLKIAVNPSSFQVTPKIGGTTYTASPVIPDTSFRGGYYALTKNNGATGNKVIVTAKNAIFT